MTFRRITPRNRSNRNTATALGYDPIQDDAPRVLATGQGETAERILAAARDNGIPIEEDPFLAAALATLDVDDLVPPELYSVVAEIFAYIYRIREKKRTYYA